ncbi:sacsin-like [Argopecten irradians]|uniref:sacsin-like n=1 Tax=Argopecten irradians TaxID=31199 RepID=UPI00371A5081
MDGDEEENSDGEMEPEYSGLEQPPLTRMLKNILSEYPDDGQILKELIQNAEDAGASVVKIMFDSRNVNQEPCSGKKKPFNKYFQGPALFFHNNAVFSEEDWRGIKMLYSSVKELDPLKVGRFGLGFKSVFHITDYPMIVSGTKLLVINPYTTYSDKVCTSFQLNRLDKYKGMDMDAFRVAFNNVFGFGQETIVNGEYKGTLFRFPLRQIGTELSGNVYNEEKIENLFDSFTTEAPITLLFLKNLEEMALYSQNNEPRYRVQIQDLRSETRSIEQRRQFCKELQRFTRSNISSDLICSLHVNIRVESHDRRGVAKIENKSWFIVNAVLGKTMSPEFRKLSQDKDLSYSPYVGIAIPYEDTMDFQGHIFCFLPLPLEQRSLTGFPVHVNGFFALSQNRRHVKWPSADLNQSAINADKSLQWNQALIREALSQVYLIMVQQLISRCREKHNPDDLVKVVYRSIPRLGDVDVKWRIILEPLLTNLLKTKFVYTENNGGQWIHHRDAVFECQLSETDAEIRGTLRQIMKQYQQNLTIIPPHVTELLKQNSSVTLLTPAFLANLLRRGSTYENCSAAQKLHLLQYLMCEDSDGQYSLLEGLKLLPLEDGRYVKFETSGCVYICDETTARLVPGCEEKLLKVDLPEGIKLNLGQIKQKGTFQIKDLINPGFAALLRQCMERNLADSGSYKSWDTTRSSLPRDWLKNLWSFLADRSLEDFTDLHLVPEEHGKYIHLHKLSKLMIVKSHKSFRLPEDLCKSMEMFSVKVLSCLPSFVETHPEISRYIHNSTKDSFLNLLDRLAANNSDYLRSFNSNAGKDERIAWQNYVENFEIWDVGRKSLERIEIFEEYQTGSYTSISEVDMLAPQLRYIFPVKYPRRLLSSSDPRQYKLAQKLGARQCTEEDAIEEILSTIWHTYSNSEKKKLMIHFVQNIRQFERNYTLMDLARKTNFVPTSRGELRKPCELYDPNIPQLKNLVDNKPIFPVETFSSSDVLIGLFKLGLKTSEPSFDLIINCINDLDSKVKQGQTSILDQAHAVNYFLQRQPELPHHYSLFDKQFMIPLNKPAGSYPTVLPWCRSPHQLCAPQEYRTGTFQIKGLNNPRVASLLRQCMDRNLTDSGSYKSWDTTRSSLPRDWLKNLWSMLTDMSLEDFTDLHLVPEEHGKYIHLHKLSELMIVKSHKSNKLPDDLCRSMDRFSVKVLPCIPSFVESHPEITMFVHNPTKDSFLNMLDRLAANNSGYLKGFNTNAGKAERVAWQKFLENLEIWDVGRRSLERIQIFEEYQTGSFTSISEVGVLAPQHRYNFPIKYPRRLLSSSDPRQYKLAQKLGAQQCTEEDAIEEILSTKWYSYSDSDKKKLMLHFVQYINQFERNDTLMDLARKTSFIPTSRGDLRKPSELYDPHINQLKALVGSEPIFPVENFSSSDVLVGLRSLGLKKSGPSFDLIIKCINDLDRKVKQGQTSILDQAHAVNYFLQRQPELLHHFSLLDKKFIVPLNKPTSSYPTVLPWCRSPHQLCAPHKCLLATTRNQRIVGSVVPLVSEESYRYLETHFPLDEPQVTDVLQHLLQIKNSYNVRNKPDLLPCISEVYNFLATKTSTREIRDFFMTEPLVWTGEQFVDVNDVYTTHDPDDIQLEPYVYCLPTEFQSIKHFFENVGCHERQTVDVLDIVQKKIKDKSDRHDDSSRNDVEKDLAIIVQILTLYKRDPQLVGHLEILFPIHTGCDTRLQLMPASECRYSNEEWLRTIAEEEDEMIYYVHPNIPSHTAQTLGVRSLTEGLLTDTEAIEPCGQHEDLIGRIKGLLDGYTDGLSVPKELIQNADDAAATKVCFLYDERENIDSRTRLIDQNMAGFQGPALWAYNNAQFTEADLRNITKLGGATKQEDETKVGKFGLGFCSVYNLTDVPSFITGSNLVIFDPHYINLGSAVKGKEPGIKINLKSMQNQKLIRRMKSQFQPFNGVFGCDMTMGKGPEEYKGTLFRLPLRTNEHARRSEIKDTAYTQTDMKELLYMLMENGGNMLLFTQNVTEIEVYHMGPNATDPSQSTLIYRTTKGMVTSNTQNLQTPGKFNILQEVSALHRRVGQSQLQIERRISIEVNICIQIEKAAKRFMVGKVPDQQSSTRWIISYSTCNSRSLAISKEARGVLPLAGIAVPISVDEDDVHILPLDKMTFGFYRTGHYFSFLPLPVPTGLPVHINATFAVAPDRRSIMWGTEDDRTQLFKPRWNHALITDAVPNAYVSLLEHMQNCTDVADEEYMSIWPFDSTSSVELQSMQKAFMTKVVNDNPRVFKRHVVWTGFQHCRFMDSECFKPHGDIIYKAAIHFLENDQHSTKIMKLQKELNDAFTMAGLESTLITKVLSKEDFFIEVLFPEIHSSYWEQRELNILVMFAVDNINEKTKNLLENTECFPTEPTGELKCARDLVHPESQLKGLFTSSEGRFVHQGMVEAGINERKKQLSNIGMIVDTLTKDLVFDRVESVHSLSQVCGRCAVERSIHITKYIEKNCRSEPLLIEHLLDKPFLPILKKPKDWTFTWKADSLYNENKVTSETFEKVTTCNHKMKENTLFEKPKCLYRSSTKHLVGSQELVMDETGYTEVYDLSVFVRNAIPIKVVCQHLVLLCETTDPQIITEESKDLLKIICNEIYRFLHERIIHDTFSDQDRKDIEDLKEHPIIYCQNVFVRPSQTALRIPTNCEPYLLGLQDYHHLKTRCKSLVDLLGIKDRFTTDDVTKVMLGRQHAIGEMKLTDEELELYTKLIKVLVNCMYYPKQGQQKYPGQLCIPDVNGFLSPIVQLCLNDSEEIRTSETMKFVNEKIGLFYARALGVKAKIKQHFFENTRAIPFGQKEELTTRIKKILDDFPCDEGIMKELLQNADDAQATELKFIIDSTHHSTEKVFDDKWEPLQGPALLVYNDSMFSASDIKGIQDLGIGSKGEDSTKTGQYGVGFNAVYHLTDAPSFLTKGPAVEEGETLCVMDPYCQFLSHATKERPGTQFMNLSEHRDNNPDVFNCYYEDKLLPDEGTVFRFPLRTEDGTVKHLAGPMSQEKLLNLFSEFEKELLESLLFIRSVKKISLSHISSGQCKTQYEVETVISPEDEVKRRAFGNKVRDVSRQLKETRELSIIQTYSVSYNITVKDSKGEENTWLIVQQIGFGDGAIPNEVSDAYKGGELGLLPIGGVAILLSGHKQVFGRAFCFLPLPLTTGLPVHVNGHFALGGETRSSLWNQERGTFKWEWNKLLLSRVIPAAYIIGMERVKEVLLKNDSLVVNTKQLDDLFPIHENAKDDNWKLLTTEVLRQIYNGFHELFYINRQQRGVTGNPGQEQQNQQRPKQKKIPVFVPLKEDGELFPAVFNTLIFHSKLRTKDIMLLQEVMRDIGIKLLDSPIAILNSFREARLPVFEVSPDMVMNFLKTFDKADTIYKCNIVVRDGGTDLPETSLRNVENVSKLLRYCKQKGNFASEIVGVPLCLTQDGKLRVFRKECELFCSYQCPILPYSGGRFVHASLVSICDEEELQKTIFKPFDIPAFAKYIEDNLSPEEFRNPEANVDWLPKNRFIPNASWISKVWTFFERQEKKSDNQKIADPTCPPVCETAPPLPEDLGLLESWNLIPCTISEMTGYMEKRTVLSSLSKFERVLDLESFTGDLNEAFGKLGLPVLDRDIFEKNPYILSLLPQYIKPGMVLNCLYLQCNEAGFRNLSDKNTSAILGYFESNIKEIKTLKNWKSKLKSLPLYLTANEEHVSLQTDKIVLLLPNLIPREGVQDWGRASGTLLLKHASSNLMSIYNEFGFTESSMFDVYTRHILAKIDCLPKKHIPVHLEYIRDNLLLTPNNKYNRDQQELIATLRSLCIFKTETGGCRRASELHSPHVALFQTMKSDQLHFPKAPYNEPDWQRFMELIGMIKEASAELILQFARQIETEGKRTVTVEVSRKSDVLLTYLWDIDEIESMDLLSRIRTIKFIVSLEISNEQQKIYPRFESGKLMAFEGAVQEEYTQLIWSSCNILPENANPFICLNKKKSDVIARKLQMCLGNPPIEKVIQHTQNICDSLKEQCETKCLQREYLENLMSDIYKHLWDHGAKHDILFERLHQQPLVYLSSENKFVACGNLVIDLEDFEEIKPYLYTAPTAFDEHFELLKLLGAEVKVTYETFAKVLEQIKQDVKEEELHPNERQCVTKAIEGLFTCLKTTDTENAKSSQVNTLYLPTEENKLMDSTQMIYVDDPTIYKAIGKETGFPYFVGFRPLKLMFTAFDISKLPTRFRPLFLRSLVEKYVDETILEVIQGHHTKCLQAFIQCPEFAEGLLRILKNDRITSDSSGNKEIRESSVVTGLQKIKVLQVKDLKVDYILKGKVVGTSTNEFGHIQKKGNEQQVFAWNFYTKVPDGIDRDQWLIKIKRKWLKLITKSTQIDCFKHASLLISMLLTMDQPEKIPEILDDEGLQEYMLDESISEHFLPECGTFVHEKWLQMLDNSTFTFDNGEYVALHLYDTEAVVNAEEGDMFIYAMIEEKVSCNIEGELLHELAKYKVNVGDGRSIVTAAYEIYKIIRKKTKSKELVVAVEVAKEMPPQTSSLKEIFKDVRRKLLAMWDLSEKERNLIFKRYLRRWHPDKNIGNEEQATETFKYIKFVWDRLTNGEPVNIDDDVDPSSYSDSRPSTNQKFYDNVYRQCSRERERYQASTGSQEGHYRSHNYRDNDPVSNPTQQRRWFKQAELDLCAAEQFMKSAEEVQGYNWICYICHQAAEKSLKSMVYGKDSNNVTHGHDIYQIAASLSNNSLMSAAGELQNLLGYHTHMRYPDVHAAGKIPSTSFTRHQAESALGIAKQILKDAAPKN